MEGKTFEKTLPEGYGKVYELDMADKKPGIIFNLIAAAVTIIIMVVAIAVTEIDVSFEELYKLTPAAIYLCVGLILYIVLHELVHGFFYKLLTKHKLTFGLKLSCAYCGVPDIYTYRKTALIAVLAPLVLFTLIFLPLMLWLHSVSPFFFLATAYIFGTHLGGCSGDIYVAWLFLFKYKDKTVLMNDTGPKITIYCRER